MPRNKMPRNKIPHSKTNRKATKLDSNTYTLEE